MIQLIYASKAVFFFTPNALSALLARARAHNARAGLTGMLLHVSGAFLQVLEGRSAAVHALFARIRADPRHTGITTLVVRDLEARAFGESSMAFFDGSALAAALPGHHAHDGFASLAGDPEALGELLAGFRDGRWRSFAA